MNRPDPLRGKRILLVALLLAGLLLAAPAGAQTVTVTSAVPDMADQGTLGLVVAISGDGFVKTSKVAFYVTGTTNPGGIAVKNVRYKNAKALEATIDVAPDAQTSLKFDIQVMSGSRTGKGTELFKVIEKVTGGDLTPPGTITDLQVVEGTVGYNTAVLTWTAPANDGNDPSSGPAKNYDVRVRRATPTTDCGPYTMDIWVDSTWTGPRADPCHVWVRWPGAGAPGMAESMAAYYLAPNTSYWAAARAVDASPQGPNWSLLPDPSQQLFFTTGPAPETAWSAAVVDACPVTNTTCQMYVPRLAFDRNGNPAMLYVKGSGPTLASWTGGTWPTNGGWLFETAPEIDGANHAYDLAFDPLTGDPAIASYVPRLSAMRFYRRVAGVWQSEMVDSGSVRSVELGFSLPYGATTAVPTIAYRWEKKSSYVRVSQKVGTSWVTDSVGTCVNGVHLAFDAASDPAVAFIQESNGGRRLVLASRKGATWTVDPLPDAPAVFQPNTLQRAELAFNPASGTFSLVGQHLGANAQIRYCEGNVGSWSCLPEPLFQGGSFWTADLSLTARDDGTVYVGTIHEYSLFVLARYPATLDWVTEFVDWNAARTPQDFHFGPGGRPAVVYTSIHDSSGAGGTYGNGSVSIAQRPAPTP